MANVIFIESGSSATQAIDFWPLNVLGGNGGSTTSTSQAVKGSGRSILCSGGNNAPTSGDTAVVGKRGVLANTGRRVSVCFRYSGTPAPAGGAISSDFIDVQTSADQFIFSIGINSSGYLVLEAADNQQLAIGSTLLAQNQDYRLSFTYTITSASVYTITVWLNGVAEMTVTNGTALTNTASDTLYLGWGAQTNPGVGMNVWFSHIYIDDGASGDPGDIRVTPKRPLSNGTNIQFTTQIGSGGSSYGSGHAQQVNERPESDSNGWSIQSASKQTEEYTIEGLAVGDDDLTGQQILDIEGWVRCKVGVNSTGNIIVAGVASNIAVTTTTAVFVKMQGNGIYPTGNTDIGMDTNTVNQLFSLYECGMLVAYIPMVHGKPENNGRYLKVGNGMSRSELAS